jgi:Na+/H+-dicarboxylate symporter
MQRMQEDLNVSREVCGFVLPLGNTINMDGNALYQGIVSLFIAQAYGIDLSIPMQLMVVLTGTFASIGAAGVPGAGMIVLSTVLASVGLPVDGIALVAGIDRILDMGRTLTNVTGDAVTACIIDKQINKKGIKL